jgi:ATP-dependent protease ClpP protease subunit
MRARGEVMADTFVDKEICASVIAANTRQSLQQGLRAMLARRALDPDTALDWGLVHEMRQDLFLDGTEVIPIQTGG